MLNFLLSFCVLFCKQFPKWKSPLLLSLLVAIHLPSNAATDKPTNPNHVLILFTGHEQIPFQSELFQGFVDEQYRLLFDYPELFSKEIYIQRLDPFRNDQDYLERKINNILKNYSELPGTIIAEGNFAVRVAQALSKQGSNDVNVLAVNSSMASLPGYSKAELFDLEATLDSIPTLFPKIKELIVLVPASRRFEVQDLWDFSYSDQFDLTLLDESLSFEETLSELKGLPSDRVILWLGRGAKSVNEDGLPIQLIRQIASLNVAPVLSMQSSTLQAGGLGGLMTVSKELGQKIAQLAYDQPEGFEPPTKRYILDYNELDRWQADASELEGPISIINEPVSIFTQREVQLFIGLLLFFVALIFALIAWWAWGQLTLRNRQILKIESLDSQLHLALKTSKLALIEENLTKQTAQWIVAPHDQPVEPLVGVARLNATEPAYRDRITEALDQIGVVIEYPLFIEALNTMKWVKNATISQHTNAKGDRIRIVLSQDVTDLKQNEIALDESVKQSNKLLRQLEETLQKQKQMFAVVGHELRTPASALHMMLEADHNVIIDSISDIRSTSQHLLAVLDDLRSVVEPELVQERALSNARPIEIVERSLTPLKALLAKNEVCCSVKSNEVAGHPFNLDQRGIRQVLTNLIKNSIVHGQGSDIQVHVDVNAPAFFEKDAIYQLRISVEDNGRGIDPSLHESIFEPFERGDTDADGTGLGLHICREIIQANGGTLSVTESDALGGACFIIEMPIEAIVSETLDDPASTVSLQGLNVLMAEDNLMLRKLSENLLQKLGAQPVLVENGQLALDRFNEQHWDLVITDIFMPEMNGYELVAAIRETDSAVKILGVTAATVGNERDMLMQAGADVVMAKPITSESLLKALLQLQLRV